MSVMRAAYRPLSDDEKAQVDAIKTAGEALYDLIALLPGREAALAKTKTEEAVMWAVKAITG